jgi:hypothetical protein
MAGFEVEVGVSALSEWASLPTRRARLAAHEAMEELRAQQFPPASFRLVGEPVWRLVRDEVVLVYVASRDTCFVTHVRSRARRR